MEPPADSALVRFTLPIRVRYHEVDGQGRVHHGQYLNYFERGRVEMLRAAGVAYKQLEAEGYMLVIREVHVRYAAPAEFDDLLELTIETESARGARVRHRYTLTRGEQTIVTARSEIACITRDGRIARLPPRLQLPTVTPVDGDRLQ